MLREWGGGHEHAGVGASSLASDRDPPVWSRWKGYLVKKVVFSILALALMAPLFGCAGAGTGPVSGWAWADVRGPVDSEGAVGGKTGEACATSYLGVVAIGDASIAKAASNGGIKTVTNVDQHTTNMLGIIVKYCTIATGN